MRKIAKRVFALLLALLMVPVVYFTPAKAADTLKVAEGTKAGDSLGWFMIETGNDMNRVLNVKTTLPPQWNGAKLVTADKGNWENQRFELIYKGNYGGVDYFLLKVMHSGYYLHRSGDYAEHRIIHQWNDTNNPNAHWALEPDGAGYYHLKNRNGGYMEASGRSDNQVWLSTRSDSSAQKWRFISTSTSSYVRPSIDDGWYMIESRYNSDYVLDISGRGMDNGDNLITWGRNWGDNQIFFLEYQSSRYIIKARHSEKYLHKSGSGDGLNVHQWSGAGNNARWCLESAGEGYYYLRNENGGYMTRGDDGNVYVENLTEGSNRQQWKFIRVNV